MRECEIAEIPATAPRGRLLQIDPEYLLPPAAPSEPEPVTVKDGGPWMTERLRSRLAAAEAGNAEPKRLLIAVVKAEGEDTQILHFVGSTEDVDRDGDILRVSGWDLAHYKSNPLFLWMHDMFGLPIGRAVKVTKNLADKRLEFEIEFVRAEVYPFADTVRRLYLGKFLRATSVRFRPQKTVAPQTEEERQAMGLGPFGLEFVKQELLELSAVTVPANPNALRLSVGGMLAQKLLAPRDLELVDDQIDAATRRGDAEATAPLRLLKSVYDDVRTIVVADRIPPIPNGNAAAGAAADPVDARVVDALKALRQSARPGTPADGGPKDSPDVGDGLYRELLRVRRAARGERVAS